MITLQTSLQREEEISGKEVQHALRFYHIIGPVQRNITMQISSLAIDFSFSDNTLSLIITVFKLLSEGGSAPFKSPDMVPLQPPPL